MNTMDVCLIVSIVRKGWAEKVISAAKSHGATGGTTMLGRGVGKSDAPKILGMEREHELEIVLVVAPRSVSDIVIREISDSCGISDDGHGILFVVPVESVIGLSEAVNLWSDEEIKASRNDKDEKNTDKKEKEDKKEKKDNKNKEEILNMWPYDELIHTVAL